MLNEPTGSSRFRTERDHYGSVDVPTDALYGINTVRALSVFRIHGTPLGRYPEFVRAYARIKKAAAVINRESSVLGAKVSQPLIDAADEVVAGEWREQFPVDALQGGGGVSANMNVNEVLANRAADLLGLSRGSYDVIHPNDHANRSQSTNDTYPSALNLALLEIGGRTVEAARRFSVALRAKADDYKEVLRLGRTCLRDALPIGIDQTHDAQATYVERCAARLESSLAALTTVPLGTTAVGTGVGAPPDFARRVVDRLSVEVGRDLTPSADPRDALQNADCLVTVADCAAVLADAMGRIASDLRVLSSGPRAGFGEVFLPVVQAGSSMMPGKTNPAVPELVMQVAMRVQGAAHVVAQASRSGELELNVMGPVILVSLSSALHELALTAEVFADHCIRGLTWDLAAVDHNLQASRLEQVLEAQHAGYLAAR
jgi:aspartate ammonia-lyase